MGEARRTEILENVDRSINQNAYAYITMTETLNEALNGNRFIGIIDTTLATETSFDVGIVTPTDCDIRLTGIDLGCDLNFAKAILYEDVTFTGSTELILINSNRQSETTTDLLVYTAFSVAPNISSATIIDTIATLGGTGVGGTSTGGADNGDGFFLLKKNTKYLIRISNEDGATANILLKIPFIETDLSD